jgi:hypothetical protein
MRRSFTVALKWRCDCDILREKDGQKIQNGHDGNEFHVQGLEKTG